MMGIERKKLSMTEKDRLNTAIHESGHALICYFNPNAFKLYKATVVARGGALGVVSISFHNDNVRPCYLSSSICPFHLVFNFKSDAYGAK